MNSETRRTYPVEDTFSRTSVTVDEAVAIMLGYADGPIIVRSFNAYPYTQLQDLAVSCRFFEKVAGWAGLRRS